MSDDLPSDADYMAYERVRKGGRYNMFDPRARRSTGLSQEQYLAVMKHFGKLRDRHEKGEHQPQESPRP